MNDKRRVTPNAKAILSFRYTGQDNYSAICDLIDNSIDADADEISVYVRSVRGEKIIVIADNGSGMDDPETLLEAIKMGSKTKKASGSLGRFGLGLTTASISIAQRITVISKSILGDLIYVRMDLDEVEAEDDYVVNLGKATKEITNLFEKYRVNEGSGTVVILTKCERLKNGNPYFFAETLSKKCARVYRDYLADPTNRITVNGQKISALDPLEWDNPNTKKMVFSTQLQVIHNGKKEIAPLTVRIAVLPEGSSTVPLNTTDRAQGFYIVRNGREIVGAVGGELFEKCPELNQVRGEIRFDEKLDAEIELTFTKDQWRPSDKFLGAIKKWVDPRIAEIKESLWKERQEKINKEDERSLDEIFEELDPSLYLLDLPELKHEEKPAEMLRFISPVKKDEKERREEGVEDEKNGEVIKIERKRTYHKTSVSPCMNRKNIPKHGIIDMGELGPIYSFKKEEGAVSVMFNRQHPYWVVAVEKNKGFKKKYSHIIFQLFFQACAELKHADTEEKEIIGTKIRADASRWLATVLSKRESARALKLISEDVSEG